MISPEAQVQLLHGHISTECAILPASWLKDNGALPAGVNLTVNGLFIKHAQFHHTGNYTCISTQKRELRATTKVYVAGKELRKPLSYLSRIIADRNDRNIYPRLAKVKKGSRQDFKCASATAPLWFFQKQNFPSEITNVNIQGNVLEIQNIDKYNAGEYYCYGYSNDSQTHFLASALLIVGGEFVVHLIKQCTVLMHVQTIHDVCNSVNCLIHWN